MPTYRLSRLFLVLTGSAVVLALWTTIAEPHRRQVRALRQLESLNGVVDIEVGEGLFEFDRVVAVGLVGQSRIAPNGLDFLADFPQLRNVGLGGTAATDETMVTAGRLLDLSELHLGKTSITDTGLRRLSQLKLEKLTLEGCNNIEGWAFGEFRNPESIRQLHLCNTAINDRSAACLARFSGLELLWLRGTRITDAALVHISGLRRLNSLGLSDTRITGIGFRHLRTLPCDDLSLEHTDVDDAGLREIAQLPRLTQVRLAYTQITDVGLDELTKMASLELVSLDGTSITDVGLLKLSSCKNLRSVKCQGTLVTENGVRQLNESGIEVVSDWGILHKGRERG